MAPEPRTKNDRPGVPGPDKTRGILTGCRYWLPLAFWAILIFVGSSLPGEKFSGWQKIAFQDKIAHLIEYAIFGYLLARAFAPEGETRFRFRFFFLLVGISLFYGALDELHQYFVPGRTVSGMDLAFDGLGGALGLFLYIVRSKEGKIKKPGTGSC